MDFNDRWKKKFGEKFNKTYTPKSDFKFATLQTAKNLKSPTVQYNIRLVPVHGEKIPEGFIKRWIHPDVGEPSKYEEQQTEDGRIIKVITERKKVSCPGINLQNCPFCAYSEYFSEEDIDAMTPSERGDINRFIARAHTMAVVLFRKPILERDGKTMDDGAVNSPRIIYLDASSLQKQLSPAFDELAEKYSLSSEKEIYHFLSNPTTGRDIIVYADKTQFYRVTIGEPSPLHPDPSVVEGILGGTLLPDMTKMWKIETDFTKLNKLFEEFFFATFGKDSELPTLTYNY